MKGKRKNEAQTTVLIGVNPCRKKAKMIVNLVFIRVNSWLVEKTNPIFEWAK